MIPTEVEGPRRRSEIAIATRRMMPHTPRVRLRLSGSNSSAFRAFVAAVVFGGVLMAIGLAAAPQLHHWLHQSDGATHVCAATLLSSGSVEHSACEPVFASPHDLPTARVLFARTLPALIAALDFARLEHAPPALS